MTLCCMTMGAGGVAISAFVSTWSIPGMRHIIFLSVPRWLRCNTSNLETTPPVGVVPGDFYNPLQIAHVAYHFSQRTEEITMQYFESGNHTPCGYCSAWFSDHSHIRHVAYHFSQRTAWILIWYLQSHNHTPCVGVVFGSFSRPVNSGCQCANWHVDIS